MVWVQFPPKTAMFTFIKDKSDTWEKREKVKQGVTPYETVFLRKNMCDMPFRLFCGEIWITMM